MIWPKALAFSLLLGAAAGAQDAVPEAPERGSSSPPEASATLPEVVVRVPAPTSKDRTRGATQVEGDRLRESPRPSTFEAIAQESADVYVPAHGVGLHGVASGATGGVRIRGLGGSPNTQVLVVEDGVPDYQGIFGHPIPDAYVPSLIDEVLVVKGGDSVLYGTNALAGALVIRNRWREQDGYEVVNDAAFGSYSTIREAATALVRSGRWDAATSFVGLRTDGHRDGAGGSEAIGSVAVRCRLTPGLSLTVRDKLVHLGGNDPGPVTHPTLDHWFDVWRDTASLQLAYESERHRLTVTPYLNAGVHRLYDGFHSRDYVGGLIAEDEVRLIASLKLLAGVAAGAVGGSVENRITGERPAVRGLYDLSGYVQATWRPLPALTFVVGGRELVSSRYGSVPLYKAGARWELPRGWHLRSGVAANFRQPTLRELYLPYPTANPALKPERALNWDVEAGYESGHLQASVTGYRTDARDLIKYFGVWPAAEVVNIDRVRIWGVEGRVAVTGLGPFSAYVSGDWQDVGRYTRQNPEARVTFGLDATHAFGSHQVGASLTGDWVHGLFMSDYRRDRIPDVFVTDLALRYRYTSPGRRVMLEPYLLLRNLLDRQYAYVQGYVMPGLNLLAGLKIGVL